MYIERNISNYLKKRIDSSFVTIVTSISSVTGNKWLSLLVNTNIVYLLEPYFNNHIKRIIKRPKIHFFDTGLASYLAGYHSVETLERGALAGPIFETYVVTEIIKSFVNIDENNYMVPVEII